MNKFKELTTTYREEWLYFLYGFGTTFVSWTTYVFTVGLLNMPVAIGNVISWVLAVLFSFVVNKVFVFGSKSFAWRVLLPEFSSFMATRMVTGVTEMVGVPVLVGIGFDHSLFGAEGMWAKIFVCVVNFFVNFILSKKVVFRERKGRKHDSADESAENPADGQRKDSAEAEPGNENTEDAEEPEEFIYEPVELFSDENKDNENKEN